MKALILNGAAAENRTLQAVHESASYDLRQRGWDVEAVMLREMKVAPCQGCFKCWMKTPGICVIDDAGRDIAKAIIQNDLLVLVTPVTFGGYSSELKKAMDRVIPLISPFFMKINCEVHHKPRYKKYPVFTAIGSLPSRDNESERIFRTLVRRNAINFHSPSYGAEIIFEEQDERELGSMISGLFSKTEGVTQ